MCRPKGSATPAGRSTMASLLLRTGRVWLQRTPQRRLPALSQPELSRRLGPDDQRLFDRVRCRLAGADFLEVFVAERFFGAATASGGVSSGNATARGMIS